MLTMPAHVAPANLLERQLLLQLGDRLTAARKQRGLSGVAVAAELGIARNTLRAAETGDPSVTMGTYLRVLSLYGMAADLALVASSVVGSSPG